MTDPNFDFEQFDSEWTLLGKKIAQAFYTTPQAQVLKNSLQKKGFLTLEEKSEFINLCNQIKYEKIYEKFGKDGTPGYKKFSHEWEQWFQTKGVESEKNRGQRSSVDHILFGSTPDPEQFLLHFEHEILGSMKE